MTIIYIYSFIGVIVVSLISFFGVVALSLKEEILRKYLFILISIAVGALLGDAFIHLIPEALESSTNTLGTSIAIVAGIFFFLIIEKFLHWHHHGEDKSDAHVHPAGKLMLLSDGVHNLMDGIIIAASFFVSIPVGIASTIAVILHEIPQEVGDFAVLLNAGYTKKRALWLNFLSALAAILGVALFALLGDKAEALASWFVPVAAGGFIYIALADLIPELHKIKNLKHSLFQIFAAIIGVAAMVGLAFVE